MRYSTSGYIKNNITYTAAYTVRPSTAVSRLDADNSPSASFSMKTQLRAKWSHCRADPGACCSSSPSAHKSLVTPRSQSQARCHMYLSGFSSIEKLACYTITKEMNQITLASQKSLSRRRPSRTLLPLSDFSEAMLSLMLLRCCTAVCRKQQSGGKTLLFEVWIKIDKQLSELRDTLKCADADAPSFTIAVMCSNS